MEGGRCEMVDGSSKGVQSIAWLGFLLSRGGSIVALTKKLTTCWGEKINKVSGNFWEMVKTF